ncbi:MAG: VanW family protein [Butyrivibrio sp.]|nr:VanW family protein [Muribaculum sp.]MCM1552062.1 VanW family protein [Butyrivibrio sp.]
MKKFWKMGKTVLLGIALVFTFSAEVQAAGADTIKQGIYAGDIELSGKTATEARAAVESYVENLQTTEITLEAAGGREVLITAGDLGMTWVNTTMPEEAVQHGRKGNIIERYKILENLAHENYYFPIELDFDMEAIDTVLAEKCVKYDKKAVNVSLNRNEEGQFKVVEGVEGAMIDVEASIDKIYDYLTGDWDHEPCRIALEIIVDKPLGSAEELANVTDLLGSFTTSYRTSGASRSANVENGCNLINGTTLYPGEEFSTYEMVSPFSEANGYYMAGSYINGRVVDSLGGGICQVSTTLYNAVLNSELEVTERHNHSMIVSYVDPSADAAIAESSGKDFRFVNNLDYPVYIEGFVKDKRITFNIYGKETRNANREVKYESEVLEVINPQTDAIYPDASRPLGSIVTESAHTGYKARLWKVVTEDGVEVSREQINSSSYKMTPRSATVGTATSDPNAYNEIMAAIGTGSIDHVRNVIAMLTTPAPAPAPEED